MDKMAMYYFAYFVFGGLWVFAYLLAVQYFILASAVCIWYWIKPVRDGDEWVRNMDNHNPIRTSIWRSFRYHLGSLALGSFVLAATWFIRLCLWFLSKQADKAGANKSETAKKVKACLDCCLLCWERFIKFLSE